MHTERKIKSVYFIARVDEAMYLVLLVEGTRRPNEKIAQVGRECCFLVTCMAVTNS